MKAGLIK